MIMNIYFCKSEVYKTKIEHFLVVKDDEKEKHEELLSERSK